MCIEQQQPPNERLAFVKNQLHRFRRLNDADNTSRCEHTD